MRCDRRSGYCHVDRRGASKRGNSRTLSRIDYVPFRMYAPKLSIHFLSLFYCAVVTFWPHCLLCRLHVGRSSSPLSDQQYPRALLEAPLASHYPHLQRSFRLRRFPIRSSAAVLELQRDVACFPCVIAQWPHWVVHVPAGSSRHPSIPSSLDICTARRVPLPSSAYCSYSQPWNPARGSVKRTGSTQQHL